MKIKYMQEFHIKQEYHEMKFWAYDIEHIEKITPDNISKIYVPECENTMCYGKECFHKDGVPKSCCNCEAPHFQELLIDGWCVGDKNGWITEDHYVATLQTGIRVPVPKEVYLAWEDGFTKDGYCTGDKVYELQ